MQARKNTFGTWEVTETASGKTYLATRTPSGDWKIEDGRDAQPINPSGTRGRKILAAIQQAGRG